MKHSKKFVAASVAATLAVPTLATAEQAVPISADGLFTDLVPNSYYYDAVINLAERGIIHGYGNGLFGPEDAITRGQAAKFITGILNLTVEDNDHPNFKDVSTTHMFYKEIAALKKAGIVDGYTDETYRPDKKITRNEMAIILTRAFNLHTNSATVPFTDVTDYMKPYVAAIFNKGITYGVNETTFAGNDTVSRAQAATFMFRAEKQSAAKPVVLEATIDAIVDNAVKIGDTLYDVGVYGQILHKNNEAALKGAVVHATVQNGAIVDIKSLEIVAEGTEKEPVSLTKIVTPTASHEVMKNDVLDFSLLINTPFMKVSNLSFAQVELLEKVAAFQFDGSATAFTIRENVKAVITGKASIEELIIKSKLELNLNMDGKVNKLSFDVAKALVSLAKTVKVNEVSAAKDVTLEALITNIKDVLENIGSFNGETSEKPSVTPPTTGGGGGGYVPPTNPPTNPPANSTIASGVVSASTETSITIDNKTYKVPATLATFFKESNLVGSTISLTLKGEEIEQITALTVNQEAKIAGNGTVIHGNVTVASENVTLKGLTIKGDLIVKGNVQGEVTVDSTSIEGKVVTEEDQTAFYSRKTVAATNFVPMATMNMTRLTITFNNSTVAVVEIKNSDSSVNFKGATVVSLIEVKSNGSIIADADVILPSVKISEGVANVELNASIANVSIESTRPVTLSGKGNFDKVDVKTDQAVTINTEGTINTLTATSTSSTAAANVTLGTVVKVAKTEDAEGNAVKPESIIENANDPDIQGNIGIDNVEVKPFTAVKIVPVPNKFGFATLSILNPGTNKIYYHLVTEDVKIKSEGDLLPEGVKEYKEGDQFIPWFNRAIHVYKVDSAGKIVDQFEFNANSSRFFNQINVTVEGNEIVIQTIYTQNVKADKITLMQLNKLETLKDTKFDVDSNGIPTLRIPGSNLNLNLVNTLHTHFYLRDVQNNYGYITWETIGNYSDRELIYVSNLQKLTEFIDSPGYYDPFKQALDGIAYELVEEGDGENKYTTQKPITSSYMYDVYVEVFSKEKFETAADVKNKVIQINNDNAELIKQFEATDKIVTALFKDDRYSYEFLDWLAPTTTMADIVFAFEEVEKLKDGSIKTRLKNEVENAEYIYKRTVGPSKVISAANTLLKTLTTTTDTAVIKSSYDSFKTEMCDIFYNVKAPLLKEYADELAKGTVNTYDEMLAVIEKINNDNIEIVNDFNLLNSTIDLLFIFEGDSIKLNLSETWVTYDNLADINQRLAAFSEKRGIIEVDRLFGWFKLANDMLSQFDTIIPTVVDLSKQYFTTSDDTAKATIEEEIKLQLSNELLEDYYNPNLLTEYITSFANMTLTPRDFHLFVQQLISINLNASSSTANVGQTVATLYVPTVRYTVSYNESIDNKATTVTIS